MMRRRALDRGLAAKDDLAAKDNAEAAALVAHAGATYTQSRGIGRNPAAFVDVNQVTASINKGILQQTAPKAADRQWTAAA